MIFILFFHITDT